MEEKTNLLHFKLQVPNLQFKITMLLGAPFRNYHAIGCTSALFPNILPWCVWLLQEKRLQEEEAEAHLDMQLAQEASYANMARELSFEVG